MSPIVAILKGNTEKIDFPDVLKISWGQARIRKTKSAQFVRSLILNFFKNSRSYRTAFFIA